MPSTPETGALLVVATPIGNLGDLPPRSREALATAALILCEDTRSTRRLLAAMGISSPPLWRCDAHRELEQSVAVLERLRQGQRVALVSDAGTPAISDPGSQLVAEVLAAGFPVIAHPGASAVAAALSVCGLPAVPFHFLGFLPRKARALDEALTVASRLPGTLVLLESGRRLGDLVLALRRVLPGRQAAICRELTKVHEQVIRAAVEELPAEAMLGEAVVVVGPGASVAEAVVLPVDDSLGSIAEALASRWGTTRREAYQTLLELEQRRAR